MPSSIPTEAAAGVREPAAPRRRNRIGSVSLAVAVGGAVATNVARRTGPLAGAPWLEIVATGFEAGVVGGLADWFAVTALFRRPLGLPIPHTDIIVRRRQRLIDGIVSTVEKDWLSPQVIANQLDRFAPAEILVDWLRDPAHVERLAAPLRDVMRAVVGLLDDDPVGRFLESTLQRQLAEVPVDRSLGVWLERALSSPAADAAFESVARSAANLASRPRTALGLEWWLNRSARKLREGGKRLVPFFLRRRLVQRKLVEAALSYASSELRSAAEDPEHPLRVAVFDGMRGWTARLAAGDAGALEQAERLRRALVESLESGPVVRQTLTRLRRQLEGDLDDPGSELSRLVARELHGGIVELLESPDRRAAFDRWVRETARNLLERHHHAIGRTVRENLESRDPRRLVEQIEAQVGSDLQYIRLNGALVGGLIGLGLALLQWAVG